MNAFLSLNQFYFGPSSHFIKFKFFGITIEHKSKEFIFFIDLFLISFGCTVEPLMYFLIDTNHYIY